jgi:glyoxylase-like metal-dependent hydrolase (beta-lactamase superfamily II)
VTIFVGRIVLSRFGSNTWILGASEGASEVAVVDPGGDPAPLLEQLEQDGTKVGGILVTHTDLDHVEGLAALVEATGADVWAPAGEADLLREGFARGRYAPVGAHEPEHEVDDGDTVEVAGMSFEVAGVPGHSEGHIAFCADGKVFSGDVLFEGSVGRVDLEGGDWETLLASIKRLIDRYGPDAVVYPGHGDPTTLGRELATNPFLGDLRAG